MSAHHVPSVRLYVGIFVALLSLTVLTVWVAGLDLGPLNAVAALGIAMSKGTLVVLYFMGVRWNTPLTKTVAVSGLLWLIVLFAMGMNDYLTRTWLGVPGR